MLPLLGQVTTSKVNYQEILQRKISLKSPQSVFTSHLRERLPPTPARRASCWDLGLPTPQGT